MIDMHCSPGKAFTHMLEGGFVIARNNIEM